MFTMVMDVIRFLITAGLIAYFVAFPVGSLAFGAQAGNPQGIRWESWSDEVFERARRENKLVILDLEAVWCHWCHVMDEKTYSDPRVARLLAEHYIAVKVDQDSRPDLSTRYEDYGWPATIFFAPDGTELVKRAGYIDPDSMALLLDKIVRDPSPEKTLQASTPVVFSEHPFLSEALKQELNAQYVARYDSQYGSWGRGRQKFLDWDSVEYSIARAQAGDAQAERMARQTLEAQRNLLDPVWGGVYQYSTGGTWQNPHFEKIMEFQAGNMKVYAQAYATWGDPAYRETAESIHRFLRTFLTSPDGAFYTSMDADVIQGRHSEDYFKLDDAARRAQGIPRIDTHIYSRENGWAIHALASLYEATGDEATLAEATTAANWIMANRSLPGGGFRHDEADAAGPYLGDNLAMGQAFLSLYRVTGDRRWLIQAEKTAGFIAAHFQNTEGSPGFVSAVQTGKIAKPVVLRDENLHLARFANNLYHVSGKAEYRALAENAMRFLATPEIARMPFAASTLLPDEELSKAPTHITIVGHKDDPAAVALYRAALRYPAIYKRLDWWDKREGAMPNPDVQYPELEKPAAFICTEKRCSLPVFSPQKLGPLVDRLTGRPAGTVKLEKAEETAR